MTFPEHLICSVMIAHLGARQKLGWQAVPLIAIAGVAPDADTITKVLYEPWFWKYHHAIGHCLIAILLIAIVAASIGYRVWKIPFLELFLWCLLAAFVHDLTDSLYYWGVQFLWPFSSWGPALNLIKYLDVFVLGIWFVSAWLLYRNPNSGLKIARATFAIFVSYLVLRSILPQPTGILGFLTGDWVQAAPQQTPVLDWW